MHIDFTAEQMALRDEIRSYFSSLITPDTLHKGQQVGALKQINKPQLSELVQIIDAYFNESLSQAA